jgi:hypothetical protein
MDSSRLALLLLCAAVHTAAGQRSEIRPGARIRVAAPGVVAGRLTATVISRGPDTVVVASPDLPSLAIPVSSITSLELSRGSSRAAGAMRGIAWGVPIGLVLGLATTSLADSCGDCGRTSLQAPSRVEWVLFNGIGGGMWGALIGAAIGRERWEPFELGRRTSIGLGNGRPTLAVGLSF